jgi:Asp-tRNA(Asn)/Glu-tRNA(Gln) amidotransferase A subunit family amidase
MFGRDTHKHEAAGKISRRTVLRLTALSVAAGRLSSTQITRAYIRRMERLDQHGPHLNSILEINPDALAIAEALDRERRRQGPHGPLHGIPILLKDNIDTADKMQTTAGSLALLTSPSTRIRRPRKRLRQAGAVLLGKTNLSERANFRSRRSSSGWSGRDGQCNNPYILDRNPCGSSSGSGAAVSANLSAVSIGTETDGSIVCPATNNGVVGIKPTVGLTSRTGVVPISHNQDTIGPFGRTVADAATVLGAMTGVDPRDPATSASDGKSFTDCFSDPTYQTALARSQGGSRAALTEVFNDNQLDSIVAPTGSPAWTTDLVDVDHFILASSGPAARAGFLLLSVPAGFSFGLPVNITFMGLAFSEPKLIALAFAFERTTHVRQPPRFLKTLPT